MSNQVCDHGHLRRSCEICQRDEEIESLRQAYNIVTDDCRNLTEKVIPNIRAERDALKDHVHRLESLCHDMAGELTVLRAIKQMQAAIDAARSKT